MIRCGITFTGPLSRYLPPGLFSGITCLENECYYFCVVCPLNFQLYYVCCVFIFQKKGILILSYLILSYLVRCILCLFGKGRTTDDDSVPCRV